MNEYKKLEDVLTGESIGQGGLHCINPFNIKIGTHVATAKEDLKYPEYNYINWIKDNEYDCTVTEEKIDMIDEEGTLFHFKGKAKSLLEEIFDFKIRENISWNEL